MALVVSVFHNSMGDFTNRGISSKTKEICLVNVDGPTKNPTCPVAMLVAGNVKGTVKIVPAILNDNGMYVATRQWCMMGGNYAATSDSRFYEAIRRIIGAQFDGAVPIHDRFE